jgi:hypothetical protein
MKKFQLFLGLALCACALTFVSCGDEEEKKPIVDPVADYPEYEAIDGKITIVAYFEVAPCNDVVAAGTYNNWDTSDPTTMTHFEPVGTLNGKTWDGWYKAVIDITGEYAAGTHANGFDFVVAAKPVQLTNAGGFDWAYQVGRDEDADVTALAGDVELVPGYTGEVDIYFLSNQPAVLKFKKWKNDPCNVVEAPKHDYTFTVTVPEATIGDVRIVGDFGNFGYPSWSADDATMILTKGGDGKYTITLNGVEEGKEYKYVLNGTWDNEELAAKEADADCANAIANRKTGTSDAVNDVVENWRGVTIARCE